MPKVKSDETEYWNPRIEITPAVREKIYEAAMAERRSVTAMLGVLLEEAIEARESGE